MRLFLGHNNTYVMCVMTAAGLLGYRRSKSTWYDKNGDERLKTRRTIVGLPVLILILLGVAGGLGNGFKV
jgi:hypothetical protein